jgi:hypothetical protein
MSGLFFAKYGEQKTISFPIIKRSFQDLAVSADWTPATGDTKLSKDQGNFANTTNNPSAIGGAGSAGWSQVLTGLEMQCAQADIQIIDSATKAVEDQYLKVLTFGHASAHFPMDFDPIQAPRVNTTVSTQFGSAATTHNVSMPTIVESGDLLIVLFANPSADTITTPTGWTALTSSANGSAVRLSGFAKKADGTEGSTTVNFITSGSIRAAAWCYQIKNGKWSGDSSNSFTNSLYSSATTGTSTSPDPPDAVTTWGPLNTLFLAAEANADGTITDSAYPANYVDRNNVISNAASSGVSLSVATRTQASSSESPGTFTIASAAWVAYSIAIRPATETIITPDYPSVNAVQIASSTLAATNAKNFWTGGNPYHINGSRWCCRLYRP